MLHLFLAPAPRHRLEIGVVMKHLAEILRIVGAIPLDEARRLDDAQERVVHLARLEAVPGDIIQRPITHQHRFFSVPTDAI